MHIKAITYNTACVSTGVNVKSAYERTYVRTYLRYEEDDLHGVDFFSVRREASSQLYSGDAGAPDVSTAVIG